MVRLKPNWGAVVIAGFILGAAGAQVQADDRVVLLEEPGRPEPGLTSALRIQLTGVAELDVRQAPETPGVSARVQAASELAQEDDVLVVTWAEPAVTLGDGSREAVLYVVGHKQGRALLEVVRVPGGDGPEVERSLALKLREVVDEVRHNRQQAEAASGDLMLEPAPSRSARGWGATVAVSGAVGPLPGSELGQWGVRMSAGPALRDGSLRLLAMLQLAVFPQLEIARDARRVQLYELGPGLLLRAQLRQRLVWLGLRIGPELSWVQAEGQSARGRGETTEIVPSLIAGLDVELPLADGVSVGAAVDLEARFKRQRFTIDGARVADLGRLRPVASIGLIWNGPDVR
jgi:hypothetical protein